MKKLNLDWENCFGINKLKQEFNFEEGHIQLVYAPNGTMKTSFANTMKYFETKAAKDKPKNRLNESQLSKYEIKVDDKDISDSMVYVINGDEEIDSSNSFVNFLASKELKTKYDEIYKKITKEKDELISKLKSVSQSSDCDKELLDAFSSTGDKNIFSVLEQLIPQLNNSHVHYEFRYNDVFDKKGAVKAFVEKYKEQLQNYISKYSDLLTQSSFYQKKNGYSFGTYQANQLYESVEDNSFFEVNHRILLQNNEEVHSVNELKTIIENEQNRVLSDKALKKIFDSITKAIDKNADLRGFKSVIEKHPDWIPEIVDYENFKKKVWLGHLSTKELKDYVADYNKVYQENKSELEKVIEKAGEQKDKWVKILELYKARFHVPFNVSIENQQDIILKAESAKLRFTYLDESGNEIETERNVLNEILSRGEKRAFIILQFIFDMESRKALNQETLLIMDDIADSFDYQNKYAIIEYIRDLAELPTFYSILLTHNYDFYRTLSSRLNIKQENMFMVEKDISHTISFHKGQYKGNIFTNVFVGHDFDDKKFISMLPFVRNLIEYTVGTSDSNYLKLTSCLHQKTDTKNITIKDVALIMEPFTHGKGIQHSKSETSFYQLVLDTAKGISAETNLDPIKIENKIVLSIAIRLLAEEYMHNKMLAIGKSESDFETKRNQTNEWTKKLREFCPNDTNLSILEEVNIMTPELIHINSFMFEPLIDMSIAHLIRLYQKVCNLKIV